MTLRMIARLATGSLLLLLAACGKPAEEKKATPPPSIITTTTVTRGEFEVVEETLGTLEVLADPKVGAEVAGRVTQVLARTGKIVKQGDLLAEIDAGDVSLLNRADAAEVQRVEALLKQQDKLAERQQALVAKGFLSKNAGEDVTAQRAALVAQLDAARARSDNSGRSLSRAQVRSPIDAVVEIQIVSPGDYVKVGDPMFQLVSPKKLRAHLPFPEGAAARLKKGQTVRLTSPLAPGKVFETRVHDIRPGVIDASRALDVLADIDNSDGLLRGGGTVNATVSLSARTEVMTVPEQSVVLRPAGKVVYVIVKADGAKKAQQKVIQAGAKRGGRIEIISGLDGTETVALDGAGFLTNGANVSIKLPDAVKVKVGAGDTANSAAKSPDQPATK